MISGAIKIPKPAPASITQGKMHNSKPSWGAQSNRLQTYSTMNNKESAALPLALSFISVGAEPAVRRDVVRASTSSKNTLPFFSLHFLSLSCANEDRCCLVCIDPCCSDEPLAVARLWDSSQAAVFSPGSCYNWFCHSAASTCDSCRHKLDVYRISHKKYHRLLDYDIYCGITRSDIHFQ